MRETTVVTETVKKSAFAAKSGYEYRKLIFPKPYLLKMELKEEKEELVLTYETGNKKPLSRLREEDILTVLAVLANAETLKEGQKEYHFPLAPENLYYDMNHQLYVKTRDVYPPGSGCNPDEFMEDYRALSGFALQKKYTYEDYKKGGRKLLSKTPLLNQIREAESPEEIQQILLARHERIETERKEKQMLLGKRTYKGMKAGIIILSVLCVLSLTYAGYRLLKEDPYKDAVIEADDAYIEADYVGCIDAMKEIAVKDMELHQKYILANAYVRSENLTQEQKTNILENLSLKEAPSRLEYWIYLGRGDIDQSLDIAMQQSDDQLLLYAYMKKKSAVETDTALSGEEKTQQLEDISSKMEPLMEQYDTTEEE